MFSNVIELVTYLKVEDPTSIHDQVTPRYKQVFCNVKSVARNEFYQAASVGMHPEIVFDMYVHDYSNEKVIRYDDKHYDVIRTYKTSSERLEVVCQSKER